MAGNLGFDELKAAVKAGSIDTVLVAMVDMQGRLIGKRFQAEYFRRRRATRRRTAATTCWPTTSTWSRCRATRRRAGSKGYGDFVLKPDMATLRRVPWLEGTALVLCDVLDHHHHDVPHSPARHAEAPGRAPARARKMRAFCASELEFYLFDESYKSAAAKRYHEPEDRRRTTSRTITSCRPPRRRA